jgi:hypothetical protein
MTPTLALAYFFWTRHRRGLTLVGGYCLAVSILCAAAPAGVFALSSNGSISLFMTASLVLCTGSGTAVGYLLLVFTFSREAQLETCESCYPPRWWARPLPTSALAGWPMLWGSAALMLLWLTYAWAERRLCGLDLPLVWPSLMAAVLLAWCQAILWISFPVPWLRLFLLIPGGTILFFTPMLVLDFDESSATLCGLLAVLLLAAYATALCGVARARCGDQSRWGWPAWLRLPWAARTRRPFPSAARAQLWFEWRLHGLGFPMLMAGCAVFVLPLMPLFAQALDTSDHIAPSLRQEIGSLWLSAAGQMLFLPLWTAMNVGQAMGKFGGKSYVLSSFLATRPVSVATLVRAKFAMAVCSTLAGWGTLIFGLLLWLTLSGHAAEAARQFETMRQQNAPGVFWGWLTLCVIGAIVLSWVLMVQEMWIGLTGRTRAIVIWNFVKVGILLGLTTGGVWFGAWLAQHPEGWPNLGALLEHLLPWLAGAAFILKALTAAVSLCVLRRRRLVPSGVLWAMPAIWFALAGGLVATLHALLPDKWFYWPGVVLSIVLLLPLTRLALAPLALSWNRHR